MTLSAPNGKQVALSAAIGAGGALVFLFAFPKGAVSTFAHYVLKLPGPGSGIALIVGPFLILVAMSSSLLTRAAGGALISSLAFALSYALVARLLRVPSDPKGAFGSPLFIAALALFGLALEAPITLARGLKPPWRCLLAGTLANVALLVFYWLVIFPRTTRWVGLKDVPLLLGICLAGGVCSSYISWLVFGPRSGNVAQRE